MQTYRNTLLVEVGMGRVSTRVGPARHVVRYVDRGPVRVNKFYFRHAPARAHVGRPAGRTLSKKQHKTRVRPAWGKSPVCGPGPGRVVDKFLNFEARPGTVCHSRPPFPQARGLSPWTGPCPGLTTGIKFETVELELCSNMLIINWLHCKNCCNLLNLYFFIS